MFGGQRAVGDIPHLLARADVCLSALMPKPYLQKIITVKVFEYFSCRKPVVAAVAGETARVIENSGGGIAVPPNDARAMAEAVLALYHDPERRAAMGHSGQRYVEANYSRAVWADRLEKILTELHESGRNPVPAAAARKLETNEVTS
jgi:glycosyltransferase involved in cell wall biosynthesis